jgi:hypothetical protein
VEGLTDATGTARIQVDLPSAQPTSGTLYFVIRNVVPPAGAKPWARGLDLVTVATLPY